MAGFLTRRIVTKYLIRERWYTFSPILSTSCDSRQFSRTSTVSFLGPPKQVVCIVNNSIRAQFYGTKSGELDKKAQNEQEPKVTLFQRFKKMYRDYWYVLVPVHLVTSIGWFGGFYYLAKSGVDIVAILEQFHVSEKITNTMRDSSMGYIAISYGLYKIATPLRYTVTLGGTTISINYLKKWGYIRPVPSTDRLKEMYQERKDNIIGKKHELMESVKEKKQELKHQKDDILRECNKSIRKMSGGNIKNTK